MSQPPGPRFEVQIEDGGAHGGLYELEQTTYYRVVDTRTGAVVLAFEGETSANYKDGQWTDYVHGGVCGVTVAPDERSVRVTYYGGLEESVPLPLG